MPLPIPPPSQALMPVDQFIGALIAAGFGAGDIASALLQRYPQLPLYDAAQAIRAGFKDAQIQCTPRDLVDGLGSGFAATLRAEPGHVFSPPNPAASSALPPRWVRPFFDSQPVNRDVQLSSPPDGQPVLVVNTGSYLCFADPANGAARSVVQGGMWEKKIEVSDQYVVAFDTAAGMLHVLRPDGTECWNVSAPLGQHACDGTNVYLQSYTDGTVVAFDAATGQHLWVSDAANSQVLAMGIAAGNGVVVSKSVGPAVGLQALSASAGAVAWNWQPGTGAAYRWAGDRDLVIDGGTVFVPTQPWPYALRASDGTSIVSLAGIPNQSNFSFDWSIDPGEGPGIHRMDQHHRVPRLDH